MSVKSGTFTLGEIELITCSCCGRGYGLGIEMEAVVDDHCDVRFYCPKCVERGDKPGGITMHVDGITCDTQAKFCEGCTRVKVDRATEILDHYDMLTGGEGDPFVSASYLLANLFHLMDALKIDEQELIDRAHMHYSAERKGEDNEG